MKYKIPFHKSIKNDQMKAALISAYDSQSLSGDGGFTDSVVEKMKKQINSEKILMTTSGSQGLNMACRLAGFSAGDEVIIPTFAYTSCANAVLLAGATPVFCDVNDDLNADIESVKRLISDKTKGIMLIHYGGKACDMKAFTNLANAKGLVLIEDAAHAYGSTYNGQALGTIGDFGVYSFHQTKNLTCGEGGALIVKDPKVYEETLIYHQKGSDRYAFVKGEVPFYQWYGIGESASPSDLLMALLEVQLDFLMEDYKKRKQIIRQFRDVLQLEKYENVLSFTDDCDEINNHLFFIRFRSVEEAQRFMTYMKEKTIDVRTHYIPLHKTAYGKDFTVDIRRETTDDLGSTVVRLPLYYDLKDKDVLYVCEALRNGLKYSCSSL